MAKGKEEMGVQPMDEGPFGSEAGAEDMVSSLY